MTLKLNRAEALKPVALGEIDRYFAQRINALLGPMAALHALKRSQALAGTGSLLDDDAEAVLREAEAQDKQIAMLDRQRRDLKKEIRAASNSADIKVALERMRTSA